MIHFVALLLLLLPSIAEANAGIPVVIYPVQWMVMFLVPVIGAEAFVLAKILQLKPIPAILSSLAGNISSTLLGVLIAVPIAFVSPMSGDGTVKDVITLLLLYPLYRLSIIVETYVVSIKIKLENLKDAIILANRISYFMFVVFLLANIIKNRIIHGYFIV